MPRHRGVSQCLRAGPRGPQKHGPRGAAGADRAAAARLAADGRFTVADTHSQCVRQAAVRTEGHAGPAGRRAALARRPPQSHDAAAARDGRQRRGQASALRAALDRGLGDPDPREGPAAGLAGLVRHRERERQAAARCGHLPGALRADAAPPDEARRPPDGDDLPRLGQGARPQRRPLRMPRAAARQACARPERTRGGARRVRLCALPEVPAGALRPAAEPLRPAARRGRRERWRPPHGCQRPRQNRAP
mmetsp:Transcript_80210/g.227115  ORF Transcript_80210/g.227115 Transcript_80210/m.227115 type:complete len:249 (+) Transcript_80210:492-1238(+)